jgi:hypothetical protein
MSKPFIRSVELRLRFRDQEPFLTLKSDGSRDGLQIVFTINKTFVGIPNESNIDIYNLKPATRKTLMQPNLQAELFVGWKNIDTVLLSSGDVIQVVPTKEGISNKTTLTLMDGMGAISSSVLKRTYNAETSVKSIVFDLASNMEGVIVDQNRIDVEGKVGKKGYTVSSRIAIELDKLARSYNFTWSIQNGIFQAIKDGKAGKTKHEISSAAGNLFSAVPQLQDPGMLDAAQLQLGMTITAFMEPKIIPGDIVTLKSKFVPIYDGDYTVHTIDFNGDTNGSDYSMKIESKNVKI